MLVLRNFRTSFRQSNMFESKVLASWHSSANQRSTHNDVVSDVRISTGSKRKQIDDRQMAPSIVKKSYDVITREIKFIPNPRGPRLHAAAEIRETIFIRMRNDGHIYSICLLWSPYVIGQTTISLPCDFYLSSSSFFFPRLISAIGDWMSTILLHMAWP